MKVLHLLDTLGRGGAEMQALDVARNARDHGIELTIAAAGGGGLEGEFRASGPELVMLRRRLPIDPLLALDLRRIIKERDIEIVHGYQPVDGIHMLLASSGISNVKRVLSFQGFIQDAKNRAAAKFLIPRMDANIVVSHGLQKWLGEKDNLDTSKSFTVIYNGADPRRLTPAGTSLRSELGIGDDSRLVGMVANFYRDRRKDQLTVVNAMAIVVTAIPNAHCIFVGGVESGAQDKLAACKTSAAANGISGQVHFLGPRNDVPDILAEIDIAIMSSFHEGLPVAISEAMLAGTALILSDIEPHLEASQDGKYAEIFPTGNAETLAEKIIGSLRDDKRRGQLAAKAKEFAIDHLSIDSHLRELKKLYEKLLSA